MRILWPVSYTHLSVHPALAALATAREHGQEDPEQDAAPHHGTTADEPVHLHVVLTVVIALGQGVVLFLEAAHLGALAVQTGFEAGDLLALLGYLAILLGEAFLVVAIEVQQAGLGFVQLFLNLGKAFTQADLCLLYTSRCV